MRTLLLSLLFSSGILLASPSWACACCAFDGDRLQFDETIEEAQRAVLQGLAPATARIFMTEAGPDAVKGIDQPQEAYQVTTEFSGNRWVWQFTSADGGGTLTLTLPERQEQFAVDLPDSREGEAGGPQLYRELRLIGEVRGDGIFAPGLTQAARYQLVFQGYGNRCLQATNLRQWRLQVNGGKADFVFFGALRSPAAIPKG